MDSIIAALKDTPIPTILVVSGIAFLLLAVAGQLAGRIMVAPDRQRWAAVIGGGLLVIGVTLHVIPPKRVEPPVVDKGSTEKPKNRLPDESTVIPPDPARPVESYRIRTNYAGFSSDVEFSVFVNDVPVGAYHSDRATADITRFIKPGSNEVRIAWTADPNMNPAFSATLIIEAKQGEEWNHLITRKVTKATKAGEITRELFHPGTTPQ